MPLGQGPEGTPKKYVYLEVGDIAWRDIYIFILKTQNSNSYHLSLCR